MNENMRSYSYGELRDEIHKILYDFYRREVEVLSRNEFDFEFMEYRTDDILRLIRHQENEGLKIKKDPLLKEPVFFDMDGTLAKWEDAHIDDVMSSGYFICRPPIQSMVEAVHILDRRGYPVYITSKVISGTTAAADKDSWLDLYLPFIPQDRRFFIPYDADSKNDIPLEGGVMPYYVLVDDSTHYGLRGWNGVGIKVDNGINNTRRSWEGYTVSTQSSPAVIADTIAAIATTEREKYCIRNKSV